MDSRIRIDALHRPQVAACAVPLNQSENRQETPTHVETSHYLRRLGTGNQSGPALEDKIGPEPLRHHDDAVAQVHEEIDVRCAPEPPGKTAFQAQTAITDDGRLAANGRE